jgi:hypothetical protein
MPATFICAHCDSSFTASRSGQKRTYCSYKCWYQHKHGNKPKFTNCKECKKQISIINKFCSRHCSAVYNNRSRTMSKETKDNKARIKSERRKTKISNILRSNIIRLEIIGPYTTVYRNVCKKTGLIFYSRTYQKYHPTIYSDRQHYSWLCRFRFSISEFPLWFDGSLIKEHGWYSTPGSRKGVRNLNGVSRDHMVSVQFGYLHNIDPKIIAHPANCQLVLHKDNQHKRSKCSITLEELLTNIEKFNLIYPNWQVDQDLNPKFGGWSST